jgi:hypothetical protein
MNKKIVWVIVAFIIVGGGSFYGGMAYAKSQTPARGQFAGLAGGAGRTGARGAGGGFTTGQVISAGNGSITIQEQSGSTEIVLVSSSTSILKSTSGSLSDLTPGTTVVVTGTANSDGSLTAQSVQIRPAGANGPMIPAGGSAPTTPAGASSAVTQ